MRQSLKLLITGDSAISWHLVLRILRSTPHNVLLIVDEREEPKTEELLLVLHKTHGLTSLEIARLELIRGDVRQEGLHIDCNRQQELADSVDVILHTAAEDSLTADDSQYEAMNRLGTANALIFAGNCFSSGRLQRFVHLSSAFVAGSQTVTAASEDELVAAPVHLNNFERSKYEAERLVRAAMHAGLPVTIFRPTMVVSDLPGLSNLPPNAVQAIVKAAYARSPVPCIPIHPDAPVHFAPAGFIVEAILRGMSEEWTAGLTFHLTADSPPSAAEIFGSRQLIPEGMKSPVLSSPEDFDFVACSLRDREMIDSCGCYFPYFNDKHSFETANASRLIALPAGHLEYPAIWNAGSATGVSNQVAA